MLRYGPIHARRQSNGHCGGDDVASPALHNELFPRQSGCGGFVRGHILRVSESLHIFDWQVRESEQCYSSESLMCMLINFDLYFLQRLNWLELLFSWMFGQFMCQMYQYVQTLSYIASIFILILICVERYCAIIHPIKCKQNLTPFRLRVCTILKLWPFWFHRLRFGNICEMPSATNDRNHNQVANEPNQRTAIANSPPTFAVMYLFEVSVVFCTFILFDVYTFVRGHLDALASQFKHMPLSDRCSRTARRKWKRI